MTVDHGAFPPLARVAYAVFVKARAQADEHGYIADRAALCAVLGLSERQLRFWLQHLEGRRWRGRALVKRRGARELWVLLAEIPGVPPRRETAVVDELEVAPPPLQKRWRSDRRRHRAVADAFNPGACKDPQYRWLRARTGGLELQLKKAKARTEADAALIASLQAREMTSSPAAAAMRADLMHAADCGNPDCDRCVRIVETLEDDDGPYATEREVSQRLERGSLAERAGRVLARAVRSRAGAAVLAAAGALELVLAGDLGQAERALVLLERALP